MRQIKSATSLIYSSYFSQHLLTFSLLRILLLGIFLGFGAYSAQATHITGADLTYTCINPVTNTYEITLTLYRDCQNGQAAFDPSITLFFFRGLTGSVYTTQSVALPANGIEIIPAYWDACTGQPYTICVEYARYVTTINLPPQFGGYNIGWARCCRNNIITNVGNNQGITVIAKVPGSEVPGCNSMPTFNQLPPLFLCVNQPFTFDHSATDADGDSLVYKVSRPFSGINTAGLGATQFNPAVNAGPFGNPMGPPPYNNLGFLPGFSYTDPFGSGNFNIDGQSGSLTLTPTQLGVSVFAISVCEYRNGVLLSENKRDFQINVVNCQPQGATPVIGTDLTGVIGSNGDTIFVRPEEAFCYDIDVADPVLGDTVILYPISAAFGIGGTAPLPFATLSFSGVNPAAGQVCWAPSCEYAGDTVMLIVGGQDTSDCPGYNLSFDTTYVVVAPVSRPNISHTLPGGGDTITVDANQALCIPVAANDAEATDILGFTGLSGPFSGLGGTATFSNLVGTNPITADLCWTPPCTDGGQTFTFIYVAEDVNGCRLQSPDTVTVIVNPLPAVDAGTANDVCSGQQTLQLQATGGTAYSWTPVSTLNNGAIANPIASPTDTTLYVVNITDPVGCVQTDSVLVPVWPLPTAFAGNDTIRCPGVGMQLQATGGVSYTWTPVASLSNANIPNPIATPSVPTTYTVFATDANGCVDADGVVVTPMDAVASADQTICVGGSVPISASGGITYSWDNAGSLSNANIANPTAAPLVTTTYTVTVTDMVGCTDTDQVTVFVNPLPIVDAGPNTAICIGGSTTLNASGGTIYTWLPNPALSATNISNPVANPGVTTTFYVAITDANGCTNGDSVVVTVNPLPIVSAGADTTKCGDTGVELTATGGISYNWAPAASLSNPAIANPVANPAGATVYTVTVTDANSCVSTDQVLVSTLFTDAGPDDTICFGDTAQLQAVPTGLTYSWDNAASLNNASLSNPTATPAITTLYTLTTTFFAGCTDTDTARVLVNALPNIEAGPTVPLCIGDSVNLLVTGGVSYAWFPDPNLVGSSLSNPLVFPTLTQQFYVGGVDANGCVNADSVLVQVNPLPIVDAGNDTAKCGPVGVMITATGGVSYNWLPPNGDLSDPVIANPIANPDSSTTYYVEVTDANGCVNSDSVFVRSMYANAGPDLQVCIFDSVQLQASNGVSYQWDASPTLINAGQANATVFPQGDTDYYVTVTDTTGCTDRDTMSVTVNPLPTTTATTTDPWVCSGGATTFNATGGVTYAWMPGSSFADSTLASATAFPAHNTTSPSIDTTISFYVLVTDANGCSSLDSLQQVVRVLPLITTNNDTVRCPGATVPLFATGGISYSWTPAASLTNPNIANPIASPDTTTLYTVDVTAVWGCSDTANIEVIVINPDAGADVTICAEDSIQLTGSGGVNYVWTNGATLSNTNIADPFAFPLTTTEYIVTVTDSLGCVDVDTMNVLVNALPPADAGLDTAICIGLNTQLAASGGISYQWLPADSLSDPAIANPIANPLTTTTYVVAVTDVNTCVETDTVVVTVNLLPPADAGADLTKCGEDSVQLQASGGVIYSWTPTTDLSNPSVANPMAVPVTDIQYIVTVTDTNGCVEVDTMEITTMYAEAGIGDSICAGDPVQLQASSIGGTPVAYTWTPAGSLSDSLIDNPIATPDTTTEYIVTVTDAFGCADTNLVQVFVNPAPPADAGPNDSICIGSSTNLVASGGVSYAWTPATSLSDAGIANPVADPVVDVLYFVTVTDANGCTAIDSLQLTVNPLPGVDAGIDLTICRRDAAFLTATGANTYVWSPATGLSDPTAADPISSPDNTTTYLVTGTDVNGCVNTDEVVVNVLQLPTATGDPFAEICLGQTTQLSVTGGQEYSWNTGAGGNSISVSPSNTTEFWVIPFENSCPGDTFFYQVEVERNLPRANFNPTVTEGFAPLDVLFENISENSTTFFWEFGDGESSDEIDPLHTYGLPGQYTVTLIADNDIGCPDEFVFSFIDALNFQIFFPNAFSPNDDGHNDEFIISASGVETMTVQIFNRFGEMIYESNDPNFRWDGRSRSGASVQEGVYVYHMVAISYKGEKVERGGSITLIR